MRPALFLVVCLLGVAVAVAQSGVGSIGLSADPEGTIPCLQVPQYTSGVLYIIATLSGPLALGINGAEFRIEVANPQGYVFYPTLYNSPTAIGTVLDLNPADPNDGSGVTVAYPSCQSPDSTGKILLGHITVLNIAGSPTDLLVKRHSSPTNSYFACPLLIACDAPVFSKLCMEPTSQLPCTTVSVPKTLPQFAADDAPVFALPLNRVAAITARPFVETISRHESELWVLGQRIESSEVVCTFNGGDLIVGTVALPLGRRNDPTDEEFRWLFRDVPFVQAKLQEGRTISEAGALFWGETRALRARAQRAYRYQGTQAARDLLRNSPLVKDVRFNATLGAHTITYKGLASPFTFVLGSEDPPHQPRPAQRLEQEARSVVDAIRSQVDQGKLILVCHGAVFGYGGSERTAAQAQIAHLLAGGSMDSVPRGPLLRGQPPLTDILEALEGHR